MKQKIITMLIWHFQQLALLNKLAQHMKRKTRKNRRRKELGLHCLFTYTTAAKSERVSE